jgi:DNA (cytosine-5)-methyltransferase 1
MAKGVLDCFSGAGGASFGVNSAEGFEVVGAVDIDAQACKVYDDNLPLTPWVQDLTEVSYWDILDHFDLDDGDVDVIMGCPPCQSFSSLRDTEPWPEKEPRDGLLRTFLRLVDEGRPPMVFFENVPGFVTKNDGKYVRKFEGWMDENGYGVDLRLVNAADYGVPQARKRSIAICVKDEAHEEVEIPGPTHVPPEEARENGKPPHKTVADTIAVDGLEELQRGEKSADDEAHRARLHRQSTMDIIRAIPPDGGSRSDLPSELELECHKKVGAAAGNVYGRMSWDAPAPTLTTRCTSPSCGRFLHPDQDRAITFREAALLMGFPRDFELPEENNVAERVVGNAVPPGLVASILKRVSNGATHRISHTAND